MNKTSPLLLIILDGWGVGPLTESNAIHVANTPNMDRWQSQYPYTTLYAHNGAVGLPEGQMGNSEVGHLNIGAGRVVYQDFTRISRAVENGDFFSNEVLLQTFHRTREKDGALHLMGLVSDGGVHSHINHLLALVDMAARNGLSEIYIHAFMDGRDTPPKSGAGYIEDLMQALKRLGASKIATISGRYYAMDRDKRWNRVQMAWEALVDDRQQAVEDLACVLSHNPGSERARAALARLQDPVTRVPLPARRRWRLDPAPAAPRPRWRLPADWALMLAALLILVTAAALWADARRPVAAAMSSDMRSAASGQLAARSNQKEKS